MSYIVRNITNRTIVLADLRVEIGPHKLLDLEKAALRDRIINSFDLRQALNSQQLMLVKHSVIYGPKSPSKKPNFDKDQLVTAIREVMLEINANKEQPQTAETPQPTDSQISSEDISKMVKSDLSNFMDELRDQINSINVNPNSPSDTSTSLGPTINPEQLAKLQEKHITKVSQNIEASVKSGRKIKLKNDKIDDLASELGDI